MDSFTWALCFVAGGIMFIGGGIWLIKRKPKHIKPKKKKKGNYEKT